jgi:replicative DNA helicase
MATPADVTLERPLPSNIEAERCILGAVLLDNHVLNTAVERLRSEDFFLSQHRHIFERMIQLAEKRHAIDTVTLMEDLSSHGVLEASGGVAYISQLADGLPRVTNVEHYARIVKEKAVLRSLIHSAAAIQEQALAAGDEADTILDRAENAIFQLAEDRVRTGLIGIKEVVRDGFERLEKIFSEGRRITGLATGYAGLDNETAGLQPSELIILAARPSMGKTALALNIASNIALRHKQPVAIFSLEMSKESLLLRMLASEARVDAHKFRTGHMNRDDWGKITGTLATLGEAPIWIDDSASSTVLEMGAKARRLVRDGGLSVMIVLPAAGGPGGIGARHQPAGRGCRNVAGAQGIGEGTEDSRHCAQPAHPRAGTRGPQAAAFRFAGIGSHRAGCGRGDVHQPAELLQDGPAGRGPRESRTHHRQTAQRPHRHTEFRVPWPPHAV